MINLRHVGTRAFSKAGIAAATVKLSRENVVMQKLNCFYQMWYAFINEVPIGRDAQIHEANF